ncbi:MAG TPA: carboxylate--amine ligase [Firmicutes bacterium]|nr:carboxylate--amine ligase [Bacillota bacterium]
MVALWRYRQIRQRPAAAPPLLPQPSEAAAAIITAAVEQGAVALDEYSSKRVLAAYGIPVSVEGLANSVEEAVAQAHRIGYPVVLKGCSTEIAHKTGKGLIYLNIMDENSASRSFKAIREAAGAEIPVLVAQMVRGERELVAGALREPGFGPCVMFGLGGIFTEVLGDTVFRMAPLSRVDAQEMLGSIRAGDLLGEYRGMEAADSAALSEILQKTGNLLLLHPEIKEIDLNPIILKGSHPVVVDALITF